MENDPFFDDEDEGSGGVVATLVGVCIVLVFGVALGVAIGRVL